jgi:hypothetical protein
MLIFKARPRKTPNLTEGITPSQRRIMNMMGSAMDEVRAQVVRDEKKITEALLHDPIDKVVNIVSPDPWLNVQADLESELTGEVLDAGRRVKLPSMTKATVSFSFDSGRPEAGAWAAKESGSLIVQIIDEQRAMVRDYVERSTGGEFTVTQVARGLRDVVGLTNQQSGWVENFRNREILEQMNQGKSFDEAYAGSEKRTAAYQKRIHKYRTETIARTETIRASSEGRQQAWAQGLEQGFISSFAKKQWIAEFDACDICTPLGDMDPIPIGQEFPEGEPPAHPNCRCDVILIDDPTEFDGLTDEDLDALLDETLEGFPSYRGVDLPTPVNAEGNGDLYGDDSATAAREWRDRMVTAEPDITRDIIDLATDFGAKPVGLDFRLKSEDSLTRKIASEVADSRIAGVPVTPTAAASSMSDTIRYTYTLADSDYAAGTERIIGALSEKGYTMRVKNYWQEGNTYKGVNVAMKDKDGVPVELQFHTDESLRVKQGALHDLYERQRVLTDPDAIGALDDRMRDVAATIPTPSGDLSFGEKIRKSTRKIVSHWRGAKLGMSQRTGRRGL